MIHRYPPGDNDRDARVAPRRDTRETYGDFGAVVYTYLLAFENEHQTNQQSRNQGRLYHPVDTPEEASYWLDFYQKKTKVIGFNRRPVYKDVYFVPRGDV